MAWNWALSRVAQFLAAFDGLASRTVAQRVEDRAGGLHAKVAGKQRRFQIFQRLFVHRAGQRGKVLDFG